MSCLDLTQRDTLCVKMDSGTDGTISFDLSALASMDVGYTLTLDSGLSTEQTYTVGSGLTINSTTLGWAFGTEITNTEKTYIGTLVSDDKTYGTYVQIFLEIEVV